MDSQKIGNGQLLITGGSGFIGSYIINLLKKEFDIVVADRFKPQSDTRYVKVDLTKPFSLTNDIKVCIHLAAHVGGIQYFTKHPVENLRNNPVMTSNLLDAAINASVKQVIYTSTSAVYEHASTFPSAEESAAHSPPPSQPYGFSKLVGEYLCKAYNEQFGLKYTILRLSGVYGPGEDPDPEYGHVIPHLIRKVLSGQFPVEIYGTGEQTRTFTHGEDTARAFHYSIKNKNSINDTFNVCGNEEIKINELLQLIWTITGHKEELKVKHLPPFPHDIKRRFLSNRKINEKLDWKPLISFRRGLTETIEWMRHRGDANITQ
jgi:nucleoside-diphosphate-sugar epimerase